MNIEVRLYATLRERAPAEAELGVFAAALPAGSTVGDLLPSINIPVAEVQMIMVNGIGRELDTVLQDSDRVGLFPPVGGG
ncbi:MAG TPA: MoaD/ThiS family protein [Patescibacteria group bacterium]|nr:MoaD/ThiS family protein [Patescibacteria group bacterium]